jgi:hypothetical protein
MALSSYPESIDVGAWPHQRRYVRRSRELVVRFDGSLDFAQQTHYLQSLGLQPRVLEQHRGRFDSLHAAGMRWIEQVDEGGPDGLRGRARELAQFGPIADATPVFMPEDGGEWDAAIPRPGDLLVRIPDERLSEVEAQLGQLDLDHVPIVSGHLAGGHRLFRLRAGRLRDDGFGFDEADGELLLDAVVAVSGVEGVEHDWLKLESYQTYPHGPSDPYWDEQWSLQRIGMEEAWKAVGTTPGVPVAVIDSGFDVGHPDLSFHSLRLDAEDLWLNGVASFAVGPSGDPHGTAVAGVVGAQVNNNRGVASVGNGCQIVPIRLGNEPTPGSLATALGWARQNGFRVANMSLTVIATSTVIAAIDEAWAAGMVLCASTGNMPPYLGARSVGFPARHCRVIGVGACDKHGRRFRCRGYTDEQWQSRYGPGVDVVAPGTRVYTTDQRVDGFNPPPPGWRTGANGQPLWLGGETDGYGGDPDYLAVFGGTSGAAPHVAGLASLILSQRPTLSVEGVRNLIERTCDPPAGPLQDHPKRLGGPRWNNEVGCGLINVAAALADIASDPPLPMCPPNPDPCEQAETVSYMGFLGRGPGTQWRIYATRSLDRWIEVREEDILAADQIPTGGWWVRVRRGAPMRRVVSRNVTAESTTAPR